MRTRVELELRCKRQQSNRAGLLDRARQLTLERSARARQTARNDLAAVAHELLEQAHIAVADRIDLLHRELAHLLAAEELASARSACTAASSRRTRRTRSTRTWAALPLITTRARRRGATLVRCRSRYRRYYC